MLLLDYEAGNQQAIPAFFSSDPAQTGGTTPDFTTLPFIGSNSRLTVDICCPGFKFFRYSV